MSHRIIEEQIANLQKQLERKQTLYKAMIKSPRDKQLGLKYMYEFDVFPPELVDDKEFLMLAIENQSQNWRLELVLPECLRDDMDIINTLNESIKRFNACTGSNPCLGR